MGSYLNPGSTSFRMARRSRIFVDKSGLISRTNRALLTNERFICVSRPRRFGKSMALDMLAAYYGRSDDTHILFDDLQISSDVSYEQHIGQYDVLKVNMQEFLSESTCIEEMLSVLQRRLLRELSEIYPDHCDDTSLVFSLKDIYSQTRRSFVILIDEWDCIFREYRNDARSQEKYLDFLRKWLKDQDYIALAYMTGILPIKKYGTHSALNMFTESSMTNARGLAPFFGFTEEEVRELCQMYQMDFAEARAWYDGYELSCDGIVYSMYNPRSIVEAMLSHSFDTYWNQTETYEALKIYIQLNIDGLKDAIVEMLSGNSVCINTGTFTNDMISFANKDDVLTLLVHLGYLSYHHADRTVSIPNKEVSQEYVNAISTMDWHEVAHSVEASRKLLESLWNSDAAAVAAGIDKAHDEISILQYNNENSLACTINLAFYFAKEYYMIIRELPAGKGFADICFLPRPLHMDKPALIVELKWDRSTNGAIRQIKDKQYTEALHGWKGRILLAGITYDTKTKKHFCSIEESFV